MKKLALGCVLLSMALAVSGCRASFTGMLGLMSKAGGEERTAGEIVDDSVILAEITHYFVQADVNDMLMNVSPTVYEGRVMLTGTVDKPETAREAVRLTWIAKGVTEVINNLDISDTSGIVDDAKDTLIESAIESRLLVTQRVRSLNYTVEVENGVVYLLGLAQSEEELKTVAHLASVAKGVKRVISYVRIKDDARNKEFEKRAIDQQKYS